MRWAEFVSCLCTGAIGSSVIWLFVVISMGRQGIQASKGPCHCTGEMARANRVSGAVRGSSTHSCCQVSGFIVPATKGGEAAQEGVL